MPISGSNHRFSGLDWLANVAVVCKPDGRMVYVNSAGEDRLLSSRGGLIGEPIQRLFADPSLMGDALRDLAERRVDVMRFEATLSAYRRDAGLMTSARAPMVGSIPVHVVLSLTDSADEFLVELVEFEHQARHEREERLAGLVRANKELIRNLAHEIKNPLGGIRGAAQLLQMELSDASLSEFTQVIIGEADRLQGLVDRLLAPHRRPRLVADVNIHEVLERVRSLILAEFPQGLSVVRDYDTSLPEFRGDKEQLIQAVLNIAHNAAQVLGERIADRTAQIVFRTRIARQITFGRHRHRLALDLHIIDNGPGIPEDIRERIFFPLVSGREGGSGLGLTLAQTFIQQHDGVIECDSQAGRTDFRILMPLY
jgi:two-component system nitrogen regulation sensor histidine kinase GlnL